MNKILSLLSSTTEYKNLNKADIVIEAGFENMEVKKGIFKQLDAVCKETAILATNTSYLSIDEIASVTNRVPNVIGTRKFDTWKVLVFVSCVSVYEWWVQ